MDKTFTTCPGCNRRVEPTAPGVIFAEGFGTSGVEGFGTDVEEPIVEKSAWFHNEACFARARGTWRMKDNPP